MIQLITVEGREPYYLVHRLNNDGLIVASVIVEIADGIDETYLQSQLDNLDSELNKELDKLVVGVDG